jgi:hypothetical protein
MHVLFKRDSDLDEIDKLKLLRYYVAEVIFSWPSKLLISDK